MTGRSPISIDMDVGGSCCKVIWAAASLATAGSGLVESKTANAAVAAAVAARVGAAGGGDDDDRSGLFQDGWYAEATAEARAAVTKK